MYALKLLLSQSTKHKSFNIENSAMVGGRGRTRDQHGLSSLSQSSKNCWRKCRTFDRGADRRWNNGCDWTSNGWRDGWGRVYIELRKDYLTYLMHLAVFVFLLLKPLFLCPIRRYSVMSVANRNRKMSKRTNTSYTKFLRNSPRKLIQFMTQKHSSRFTRHGSVFELVLTSMFGRKTCSKSLTKLWTRKGAAVSRCADKRARRLGSLSQGA